MKEFPLLSMFNIHENLLESLLELQNYADVQAVLAKYDGERHSATCKQLSNCTNKAVFSYLKVAEYRRHIPCRVFVVPQAARVILTTKMPERGHFWPHILYSRAESIQAKM